MADEVFINPDTGEEITWSGSAWVPVATPAPAPPPTASIQAPQVPNWGAADIFRQILGKISDDPLFHKTTIGMEPQVDGTLKQEAGIRNTAATALELLGSLGGGAAGAISGAAASSPAGGYVAGAAGSEAGYLAANQLNKKLGLRPDIPENSFTEQLEGSPQRLALDLALPLAGRQLARAARVAIDPVMDASTAAVKRGVAFTDVDNQLMRALSDDPAKTQKAGITEHLDFYREKVFNDVDTKVRLGSSEANPSSFAQALEKIDTPKTGLIDQTGKKIDEIADAALVQPNVPPLKGGVPVERIKLKDIVDLPALRKEEEVAVGIAERSANSVVDLEIEALAKDHLPSDRLLLYNQAISLRDELERKLARTKASGQKIKQKEAEYLLFRQDQAKRTIDTIEREMGEIEFTPKELRQWKTKFYNNARLDRSRVPNNIESQRSETYKALGNAFQDAFAASIKKADPTGRFTKDLDQLNTEYKALINLRPFLKQRAGQAELGGKFFTTGSFQQRESLGAIRRLANTANPLPETATPETRFMVGTGKSSREGLKNTMRMMDVVNTGADRFIRQPFYGVSKMDFTDPGFRAAPVFVGSAPHVIDLYENREYIPGAVSAGGQGVANALVNARDSLAAPYPPSTTPPGVAPPLEALLRAIRNLGK